MPETFTSLISNLNNNLKFLIQDYIGLQINYEYMTNVFSSFLLSSLSLPFIFLTGFRIRKLFFKNVSKSIYKYFVDFSLGYISISSLIGILGFTSFFNRNYLLLLLIFVILTSIMSLRKTVVYLKKLNSCLKDSIKYLYKNKFVFVFLLMFIFLAQINLINLEIREDQYHIDFSKMYLQKNTIMIEPKEQLEVSGAPMLSEMYYAIGLIFNLKEFARFTHFYFYLLILLTLITFAKKNENKFAIYAPIIFASAPVIIKETSSAYVDFQWIFCFILSSLVIRQKFKHNIIVAGIITGGMLAGKLWTIPFLSVYIFYIYLLNRRNKILDIIKKIFLFTFFTFLISSLWYLRSYLLTGSPIFPVMINQSNNAFTLASKFEKYIGLNYPFINIFSYLNVYSPLFYFGLILFFYKFKKNISVLIKNEISLFLFLMVFLFIFIHYPFGRYTMGIYVLFSIFSSIGINNFHLKFSKGKYITGIFLLCIFTYYFLNSLMQLPYAIGFANENKYLTRILSRDGSSYYNFDKKFEKHFNKNDCIATYKIFGFYYADFCYSDVNFILNKEEKSLNTIKRKGFTKLLTKMENAEGFCKKEKIKNCDYNNFKLIDSYMGINNYYLYELK